MKSLQILTLVSVLFFAGITDGQSKGKKAAERQAVRELHQDLQGLFDEMPFEDIMCNQKQCTLSLCFKINDEGVMEFYHFISKNPKLVEYSKEIFSEEEIKVDKTVLSDEIYWIKIVFKYKKF